jgi:hypothetical protein
MPINQDDDFEGEAIHVAYVNSYISRVADD